VSPGSRPARAPSTGITLLELAISLALISLVALLAIPAFYSRPEVTLDRAAQLLARDLQLAQNDAVRWRQDVHFHFLPDGRGYAPRFGDGRPMPNPVGGGALERDYGRDGVFQGVRIERLQLAGDPRAIRFDRLGFAHGAGFIELSFNGRVCRVEVDESSGLVSLHGLSGPER
jgi:Tfp pilus assembly protein FimT